MRVLTVNMAVDTATGGGTATRTVAFSRALTDLGVDCTIATAGGTADDAAPVPVIRLPATLGRFRLPYAGLDRLGAAVAGADVVLLMNHWTPINLLAWRAARERRKPYAVCPAGSLAVAGRSTRLKELYNAVGGRQLVHDADAHIAVTADEAASFAPYGVPVDRVAVVPNGMPVLPAGSAARFRQQHGLGAGPICLFIGRFAPIKGPDLLVDAFLGAGAAVDGWTLVLAGPDDGLRAEIETRAAATDGRVRVLGFLEAQAKADALAASTLVAVPSRSEAMSIVVLEAAAAGRPALVTDQCGLPEVASSGGGWVVPASVEGLRAGLEAATSDAAALARMGTRWQACATDRYAWPRVGQALIEVLTTATSRRGAVG